MIKLSKKNITEIARIHKDRFNNMDFISSCNIKFIEQFYDYIYETRSNIIITQKEQDRVVAYAYFSLGINKVFKEFAKKYFIKILFTPSILLNFITTIYLKLVSHKENLITYENELTYIAVSKKFEGKGYSKNILREAEKILLERNIKEYFLQVYQDNERAVNFYKNIGFIVVSEFASRQKSKLLLKKVINDKQA